MIETENKTAELYAFIYKNVNMGAQSINDLLPKVKDEELKTELTVWLSKYEEYARIASNEMYEFNVEAKKEDIFTKMSAKVGIKMNTMIDSTSSHIAQMMMEGCTMGITDLTKMVNEYENTDCAYGALSLAKEIITFEEQNLQNMKKYL